MNHASTSSNKDGQLAQPTGEGPLIVIVGPTAVGKTYLAVRLAEEFAGEIVSADSRQVYRAMDIGTAKPSAQELTRVPHHLVDIVDLATDFHVAEFQAAAYATIDAIHRRGKLPFLVGGTGQYVQAVIEGWQIPPVAPDPDFREGLYAWAEAEDPTALHQRLERVDPDAASRIHPNNVRRVIRALEVFEATGRPISDWQAKVPPPYRVLQIGLTMDRDKLYDQIDQRVDAMVQAGLADEVRTLLDAGYTFDVPAMSSLGYGEFEPYFAGEVSLEDVVQRIKHETHRFVRHQYNWFSEDDPDIHWFDAAADPYPAVRALVDAFLEGRPFEAKR